MASRARLPLRGLRGGPNDGGAIVPYGSGSLASMYDCVIVADDNGQIKPAPRSGHRVVADDANLYCFGGYNPNGNHRRFGLFPELWRFNLATRKWSLVQCEDCPEETASHSMILVGNSLLVWGGTGFPFGERCSNSLHAYHIPSKKWHAVPCGGDVPTARYGQSMTYKDGCIFVMGGTTGYNYNMKVHKLNLETLRWEDSTPATTVHGVGGDQTPPPRYRHEIATSGCWIYVLGGGTAQMVFNFEQIPAYNSGTKQWANMNSIACPKTNRFPPPRKFHAAVQHGNYAYLCGGYDGNVRMYDDIWRLDLTTLQWTMLKQSLPVPIYFHSATVTQSGCMYVFGGVITENGEGRSNHVFKMWLNVPTLEELAWEAIVSRHHGLLGKLDQEDHQKLRATGFTLPPKFVARLK